MAEELIQILEKFPLVDSLKFTRRVETADKTPMDDANCTDFNSKGVINEYKAKFDELETFLLRDDKHLSEMMKLLEGSSERGVQLLNDNLIPLLFHLIANYHPNFNALSFSSHRVLRIIIRDNRLNGIDAVWDEKVEAREEINADTTLRLQVALHYAFTCVRCFPEFIDSNNLAISFGAIIGSLQGGDPLSPEVAIVVCSLEFVAKRLNEVFRNDENCGLMTGQNNEGNTFELEKYVCEPLAVILVYGLEMVPSTIVAKLCEVIDSIFKNIPKQSEIAFAKFIQQAIKAFGDPSRRALLYRWHLGKGRARM